jgi:Mg/Co/Ni transporter MgtE
MAHFKLTLFDVPNVKTACSERTIVLYATLMLEIPVLLMISGCSDRLCNLVGRRRYYLMMGFLPLMCSLSGIVGLQSGALTNRGIIHSHVTSSSFIRWLLCETSTAAFLGIATGIFMGSIALFASKMDASFAITVMFAQIISTALAGMLGVVAPLLLQFVSKRESLLWNGLLETAIQDIIGSFAVIVVSYHILATLGDVEIAPADKC